ncbi:MAG: helix-turn-helix domain-containing protein [Bacteroidota bacterium]
MEIRRTRLAQFKDEWIDGQEVMQSLYISKRTLQTLRDQEKLPYSRINGKFYYKVSDLETLLQSNYSHSKRTGHGDK